ncbi:MAG: methionyl-tRNA synthetase [Candidatus Peregrinibacteria bacterium Gr01-1014_25]|nr:MAG: methionyl-tRNA synthetase [Candidatus Peregrinibacteria bacterium Gr01-1014_25]
MPKRHYITTAIDYPNAPPHMGHVLEKVLADVVARWWRLSGREVRFQVGTDEHGLKIQQTAKREGIEPSTLVERNVPLFKDVYDRLDISYDVFIRTTDRKRHWPTVVALWKALRASGALEKRTYKGLYCVGCEKFVTKKDLVDGKCPDHGAAPQEVSEENWFFLLAREQDWLRDLLTREDGYRIEPAFRANETLALLDQGLEDVSFSRPVSSLSWGIPVPDEEGQTMYVWCDALTNYLSGVGGFVDSALQKQWWDDAEVTHVIGKDIARFHALIWPAMLKTAGLPVPPPHRLLIHGFITSDGQKMSKSLGNVVDPKEVMEQYGVDALRFFLMYEIPVGNDGDFSRKRFDEMYDAKLRNQLGNLLNRVLVMIRKEGEDLTIPGSAEDAQRAVEGWSTFATTMERFEIHHAIQQAFHLVDVLNVGFDRAKPWTMKGEEKAALLARFAESLRHVALLLLPFIPKTAQQISEQLGVPYADRMLEKTFTIRPEWKTWGGCKEWKRIGEPSILFAPVEA